MGRCRRLIHERVLNLMRDVVTNGVLLIGGVEVPRYYCDALSGFRWWIASA